jgi:hypothetical protein
MSAGTNNRIEVRLRELPQLFNMMDPSPFIDRDLDADAEEFIVSWARELTHHGELELVVHLATPPLPERAAGTEEAVRHYFASRAEAKRRELRQLLRRGRISLLIGVLFLAACFGLGQLAMQLLPGGGTSSRTWGCRSWAGWRCGGRWRSTSTIGGRCGRICACCNGWRG